MARPNWVTGRHELRASRPKCCNMHRLRAHRKLQGPTFDRPQARHVLSQQLSSGVEAASPPPHAPVRCHGRCGHAPRPLLFFAAGLPPPAARRLLGKIVSTGSKSSSGAAKKGSSAAGAALGGSFTGACLPARTPARKVLKRGCASKRHLQRCSAWSGWRHCGLCNCCVRPTVAGGQSTGMHAYVGMCKFTGAGALRIPQCLPAMTQKLIQLL